MHTEKKKKKEDDSSGEIFKIMIKFVVGFFNVNQS